MWLDISIIFDLIIKKSGQDELSSLPLVQVILPVVCAAFVAVVVLILACCLTRKWSGTSAKPSPRSIYSIDTSNDTSECGIYDITNEVQTKPQTKVFQCHQRGSSLLATLSTPSCQSQITFGSPLTSSYGIEGELPKNLTPCLFQAPFAMVKEPEDSKDYAKGQDADNINEGGIEPVQDCHTDFCDGGDYETLTRHCKGNFPQERISSSTNQWNQFNSSTVSYTPKFQQCEKNEISDSNHLLCQLTLFVPPSDCTYNPTISQTLCLYSIKGGSQTQETLLETLQNSKLLVIPQPTGNSNISQEQSTDMFLSPVNDEEKEIYRHLQSSVQTLNLSLSSPYSKIKKRQPLTDPSVNKLQLRRSSSFQEENNSSDAEKVVKSHRRRCSDFAHSSKGNPAGLTDKELQKIFVKLGPLPPVPPQEGKLSDKTEKDTWFSRKSRQSGCLPMNTSDKDWECGNALNHSAILVSRLSLYPQEHFAPVGPITAKPPGPNLRAFNNDLYVDQSQHETAVPCSMGDGQYSTENDQLAEPIYFELEDHAAFYNDIESDDSRSISDVTEKE